MKCHRMWPFIWSALFAKTKTFCRERNTILFGNYNLWPLTIFNGQSWLNPINLYGKFHWSTKGYAINLEMSTSSPSIELLSKHHKIMRMDVSILQQWVNMDLNGGYKKELQSQCRVTLAEQIWMNWRITEMDILKIWKLRFFLTPFLLFTTIVICSLFYW